MEKMTSMASCLIRTRQYYIGFPSRFTHYPEGMPQNTVDALFEYVQSAMNAPNLIQKTSRNLRRIVISTGKYLVIGISGYARNLVSEDEDNPIALVDEAKRPSYGFIGFVWDLDKISDRFSGFPSMASFGNVFRELIVSHWEDSNHSRWAADVGEGIEVPYQYSVAFEEFSGNHETVSLNYNKEKIYTFDSAFADSVLSKAIAAACERKKVSVCTDLYLEDNAGPFSNLTGNTDGKPVIVTENKKYVKPAPAVDRRDEMEYPQFGSTPESSVKNIETEIAYLKFKYDPSEEIESKLKQFLSQLTTRYLNRKDSIDIVVQQIKYVPSSFFCQTSNVWEVSFSHAVSLDEFKSVCRSILSFLCSTKVLTASKNGQCVYQEPDGQKEFHIFVSDKDLSKKRVRPEEILLLEQQLRREKKATNGNPEHQKRTEKEEKEDKHTPVRIDPSVLQSHKIDTKLKQEKSSANTEDLFKF